MVCARNGSFASAKAWIDGRRASLSPFGSTRNGRSSRKIDPEFALTR